MKRRFLCLLLFLSFLTNSCAAGVPGAALGGEVASVMLYKAGIRGFAANDPRFGAALAAVGTAALEVGGAVVVAGTAPAWGTVLASAAIAGAVGYGLQALSNWLFNGNGTATISSSSMPPTVPGGAAAGSGAYCYGGYCSQDAGSAFSGYLSQLQSPIYDGYPFPQASCSGTAPATAVCSIPGWYSNSNYHPASQNYLNPPYSVNIPYSNTPLTTSCPAGQVVGPSGCMTPVIPLPPATAPVTKPVADALAGLSDADKAKPLSPADVASIADGLWKQAASRPGYSGLPYVSGDPITAADVTAARAANPSAAVSTVSDLAAPIASTAPVSLPSSSPSAPSVGTGVNPSTTSQVNLGNDPGIGAPTLETTPTAKAILTPVFNLLPTFRNFVVPSHSGACPKPSMTIFNKYMVMDAHCAVIENIRPTLYALMFFVWLFLAALIILAA